MNNYGLFSRLFHRLTLGNNLLSEITFDLDRSFLKKSIQDTSDRKHIFVTGLARAGTTLLMRILYQTGEFSSLTYRDLPFILSLNLWGKVADRFAKSKDVQERIHGDGVLVDFDSPEALEEVFWRVFAGRDYIHNDCLVVAKIEAEVERKFCDYVSLILTKYKSAHRYLSKNNNNILRLASIRKSFPESIILVPFRDPVQQANSLLTQHLHLKDQQRKDPFIADYMRWLVHHEFGSDHRPFKFAEQNIKYHDESIDYWLQQWINAYSYLLGLHSKDQVKLTFICYESLCESPQDVWKRVVSIAQLPADSKFLEAIRSPSAALVEVKDSSLLDEAFQLYSRLKSINE